MRNSLRRLVSRSTFCGLVLVLLSAANSPAAFVFTGNSSDGHAVSGSAAFTLNDALDTVTVVLTNTTTTTLDAGELFTGLDFRIGGLATSMTSDMGIQRTVAANGTYSDTLTLQDLSWSLVSLGSGNYQLNFNPDAKDSILGPPSGGNYAGANGSIKGNNGHNPFAAQTATFQLSVPGLTSGTKVGVTTFRYGTELEPATGTITPEPACCLLFATGGVGALLFRRRTCTKAVG
ncbi:MAG: hypothetical protein AB7G28_22095 [Pirellulales bacterium]